MRLVALITIGSARPAGKPSNCLSATGWSHKSLGLPGFHLKAYADRPRLMTDDDLLPNMPGFAQVALSPARAFDNQAFPSGGAGMVGTAIDTLKLLEALRLRGDPILSKVAVEEMGRNQIGSLPVVGAPGWLYGLGFSVLSDPQTAGTPESTGTWRWGGAYGYSWFVDPAEKLSVVAFTNTAFEHMSGGGRFPQDITRAIYAP